MGYVPYVGFSTHCRTTVMIHLYFKRLMIKQIIRIKKKKKRLSQRMHTTTNLIVQFKILLKIIFYFIYFF
jgi:uncharacterized membrane protein